MEHCIWLYDSIQLLIKDNPGNFYRITETEGDNDTSSVDIQIDNMEVWRRPTKTLEGKHESQYEVMLHKFHLKKNQENYYTIGIT